MFFCVWSLDSRFREQSSHLVSPYLRDETVSNNFDYWYWVLSETSWCNKDSICNRSNLDRKRRIIKWNNRNCNEKENKSTTKEVSGNLFPQAKWYTQKRVSSMLQRLASCSLVCEWSAGCEGGAWYAEAHATKGNASFSISQPQKGQGIIRVWMYRYMFTYFLSQCAEGRLEMLKMLMNGHVVSIDWKEEEEKKRGRDPYGDCKADSSLFE